MFHSLILLSKKRKHVAYINLEAGEKRISQKKINFFTFFSKQKKTKLSIENYVRGQRYPVRG